MSEYDSTADVMAHKELVKRYLHQFENELGERAAVHDNSKLFPPEKEGFDHWTPELKTRVFGTEYYKQALDEMGAFLQHHYQVNSHHPEHYENGIDGMDLFDLVEMVCDWRATAEGKGVPLDLEHAAKRFHLAPQLVSIIKNAIART